MSVKAHGWYPFEFIKVKDTDLGQITHSSGPELPIHIHPWTSLEGLSDTVASHVSLVPISIGEISTGIPQPGEIRQSLFL